ncbi:MAG: maleylacetoacetate isomerase [Gammaproteobacteria bacterium]|nr:maleylacetoacetate isomerase [Gammaproteobacteria bacterium]
MELHGYFRSSASYRVRIALNLKELTYHYCPVNLLKGEQRAAPYRNLNPQGLVPTLVADGNNLHQSLAILEWLEEVHPHIPLLPTEPLQRAHIRALAYSLACDTQPLQNSGVLNYLLREFTITEEQKLSWIQHWIDNSFCALEKLLQPTPFAAGAAPGLFECCLIPQVYNAQRFDMDTTVYPKIHQIAAACAKIPEFDAAKPEAQPDSTL